MINSMNQNFVMEITTEYAPGMTLNLNTGTLTYKTTTCSNQLSSTILNSPINKLQPAKAQHNTWVTKTLKTIPDNEKEAFADFHAQTLTNHTDTPQGGDPYDRSPFAPAPINWSRPEFIRFLENKFPQQYETYTGDSEKLHLEVINNKLKIMGKTIEKETYITSEKQKLEQHEKNYQTTINQLHQFFT